MYFFPGIFCSSFLAAIYIFRFILVSQFIAFRMNFNNLADDFVNLVCFHSKNLNLYANK